MKTKLDNRLPRVLIYKTRFDGNDVLCQTDKGEFVVDLDRLDFGFPIKDRDDRLSAERTLAYFDGKLMEVGLSLKPRLCGDGRERTAINKVQANLQYVRDNHIININDLFKKVTGFELQDDTVMIWFKFNDGRIDPTPVRPSFPFEENDFFSDIRRAELVVMTPGYLDCIVDAEEFTEAEYREKMMSVRHSGTDTAVGLER